MAAAAATGSACRERPEGPSDTAMAELTACAKPVPECRHFAAKGSCLYGEGCRFRHVARPAPASAADEDQPQMEAERILADDAFISCRAKVNTMRRTGAARADLLKAIAELEALGAQRRALRAPPRSRYATRKRLQNEERSGVLRRFLVSTYSMDVLRSGGGVIDVAGGRGGLAFELANMAMLPVTVVDPRPLDLSRVIRRWRLSNADMRPLGAELPSLPPAAEEDPFDRAPTTTAAAAISAALAAAGAMGEAHWARAAREVHADWKARRQSSDVSLRPVAHWQLMWEGSLWTVVVSARGEPPDEAQLSALRDEVSALHSRSQGLRWTPQGLVGGEDAGYRVQGTPQGLVGGDDAGYRVHGTPRGLVGSEEPQMRGGTGYRVQGTGDEAAGGLPEHDGGQYAAEHGDQPGDQHGDQPGDQRGDQPGDQRGDQPGNQRGDQPGDQRGGDLEEGDEAPKGAGHRVQGTGDEGRKGVEERGAADSRRDMHASPPSAEDVHASPPSAEDVWTLLTSCSAIVGMHPDGATESIVDFALATGKPFAIVPCCVYSTLCPKRRDGLGRRVSTYRAFIEYLVAKAPDRIGVAALPFEGKNLVLYARPEAVGPMPPCTDAGKEAAQQPEQCVECGPQPGDPNS